MMQSIHVLNLSFKHFGFVTAASNLCFFKKIMSAGIVPNKSVNERLRLDLRTACSGPLPRR
jgi:hypothetical protein